jgi:hypothetical protein
MSAIVLNTSGSWLLVRECSSFGLGDAGRALIDLDIGVGPVALGWFWEPVARLAPRQGHAVADLFNGGFRHDMYDELPRSQACADLEVWLVHYDFFLDERLLDEDDRLVLLEDDRLLVPFFVLDREEPTFEPRLVWRVRRLRELPEPDPDPWPSMPAASPTACWAPC